MLPRLVPFRIPEDDDLKLSLKYLLHLRIGVFHFMQCLQQGVNHGEYLENRV